MLVYVSEDARAGEPDARPAADARATARWEVTLDPIRCTLFVKSGGNRVLTSGQNQLFPSRGYIAETYAAVCQSDGEQLPITAPHHAKVYPLRLLMDRGGWVGFTPYCLHRKPAAWRRGRVSSPNSV